MMVSLRRAAAPAALALAWTTYEALTVALSGRIPGAVLTLALTVGTLAVAFAAGWRDLGRMRALGPQVIAQASLAGAAGMFLAPYLVVTNRYTDAPSGTELLFFSGVVWGAWAIAVGAIALWRSGRRRASAAAIAGGLSVLTGAAGILGNWERPSSFSPMVRFVGEELWMVAAGAMFVLSGIVLARLTKSYGPTRPLIVAGIAASVPALTAVLLSADGLGGLSRLVADGSTVALWSGAWAISWLALMRVYNVHGAVRAGACLTLPPLLLPALSLLEEFVGVRGPDPMIWSGIAGGALLTVAGMACLVQASARSGPMHRWARYMAWLAGLSCAAALVALFLPALQASVLATRQAGLIDLTWTLPGWETVAGWTAVSGAALLCAGLIAGVWWSRLAALAIAGAYPLLLRTPVHVLTRGLTFEIQQDFGTTYASITFAEVAVWPARIAVVGAVLGLAVLLFGDLRTAIGSRSGHPPVLRSNHR
jgi:hypothetical protein